MVRGAFVFKHECVPLAYNPTAIMPLKSTGDSGRVVEPAPEGAGETCPLLVYLGFVQTGALKRALSTNGPA